MVAERACASFSARIFASVSVFTSRSVSSSCDARWFASAIAFFALSRVLSRSRSALATRLAASWRILVTASSISVTARAAKAFASSSAACASTAASDANLFSAAAAASTSPPCSVSMYCDPVNPPPSPDNPSPKTPPRRRTRTSCATSPRASRRRRRRPRERSGGSGADSMRVFVESTGFARLGPGRRSARPRGRDATWRWATAIARARPGWTRDARTRRPRQTRRARSRSPSTTRPFRVSPRRGDYLDEKRNPLPSSNVVRGGRSIDP